MKLDEMHQFFEEEKRLKEKDEKDEKEETEDNVIEEMEKIVYDRESVSPISGVEIKKYTQPELKNMKLEELQTICKEMKIDIQKKSEKTIKMLNRTKQELIDDILSKS